MTASVSDTAARTQIVQRQHWMRVLAGAGPQLSVYSEELRQGEHHFIRPAEIGMVMVRGKAGGNGMAFNLGEMTVTRCVVQVADGRHGHSYVAGRGKSHAELAALADAYLQGERQGYWLAHLIEPLERKQEAARTEDEARSAATTVNFVTMVRGEND